MMDRGLSTGTHQSHDGLRERNARDSATAAPAAVESLAASGEVESKDKAGSTGGITFGRTPDGTGMSSLSLVLWGWGE